MRHILSFFQARARSFGYAFTGLWYVIRTQKNAWLHAIATICVTFLGLWLQLSTHDWATLILTISAVWTAEIINTSLEAIVDLTSPQEHRLARVGKDVGAAAVLVTAVASIMIGFLILGPPLWEKISHYYQR